MIKLATAAKRGRSSSFTAYLLDLSQFPIGSNVHRSTALADVDGQFTKLSESQPVRVGIGRD